jgi:hypothetical protein
VFLITVGMLTLGAPLILARWYWFRIPLAGIALALDSFSQEWCSPGPDGGQGMV